MKWLIEVFHYFDVPWEFEVLCCLYILILFAGKIMLKIEQKTTRASYVRRVFLLCKDIIRGQSIQYLYSFLARDLKLGSYLVHMSFLITYSSRI